MRTLTIGDQALLATDLTPPATDLTPPAVTDQVAMWWAGDLVLTNGDPVSGWTDRIGGRTLAASSTARPTYESSGFGAQSRPAVAFDGNDVLRYAAAGAVSTSAAGVVVAVCQITTPTTVQSIWSSCDEAITSRYLSGATSAVTTGRSEILQRYGGTNGDLLHGNTDLSDGAFVVLEWASDGSTYYLRVNNSAETLTVRQGANRGDWFADTQSRDSFVIGALLRSTTTQFLTGKVAALLVADSPLSSGDRSALYGWIAAHYS